MQSISQFVNERFIIINNVIFANLLFMKKLKFLFIAVICSFAGKANSVKLTEDMMKTVGGLLKPGEIESWRGLFDEQKKILLLIQQLL